MSAMIAGEDERACIDAASLDKVVALLVLLPNGVQAMSMDLPGLVETSCNMGVIKLHQNEMSVQNF